ncbi:MAG: hypothetical protein Q7S62_00995 [bacterium]|nr:hypothetical protein [bacterium]
MRFIGRFIGIVLILGVLVFDPGFVFGALDTPTLLYPTVSDSPVWKGKIEFRWNATGAPFYKYFIDLPDGSAKTAIVPSSLVTIYGLEPGTYHWRVSACDDGQGAGCVVWSGDETFEIVLAPAEFSGGLIPCGREVDDASTPGYDESDPCGISHIFLLLKNLLDFVLWKVSLFVLLILTVITGATSYFSLGGPNALARIKTVFRSFLVGFLVMVFAWMLVNIILTLFGFQSKFFGKWWEISF